MGLLIRAGFGSGFFCACPALSQVVDGELSCGQGALGMHTVVTVRNLGFDMIIFYFIYFYGDFILFYGF